LLLDVERREERRGRGNRNRATGKGSKAGRGRSASKLKNPGEAMKTFRRRVLDLDASAGAGERGAWAMCSGSVCDHELRGWFVIGWFVMLYPCGLSGAVCL
jgi:hypothetical protein